MPTSGGEGDWPTLDELKQALNVTDNAWDNQLDRILDAAIEQVKLDVGDWDEMVDEPDNALAAASLVKAEMSTNTTTDKDVLESRYGVLLKGHRRRFPIG